VAGLIVIRQAGAMRHRSRWSSIVGVIGR
jgi:hypothetical protein